MAAVELPEPEAAALVICKRCNIINAAFKVRADPVCEKCFLLYITTKAVKRLETYRSRGSSRTTKKLLLPISFGLSSTCLLHIFDKHLKTQHARMGRILFELVLIHIKMPDTDSKRIAERENMIRERFPFHMYTSDKLESVLDLDSIDWASLGLQKSQADESESCPKPGLDSVLDSMTSVTSRADVTSILLRRLLLSAAEKYGCESILFGDTATRLAEKTLTETAKGRGFSLPWQVSDGTSPYGVNFYYPMRDLLKKELVTFSSLIIPQLTSLILRQDMPTEISASSRSITIDQLMAQYFETVEENYPSIVANVVRTSSKLNPPSIPQNSLGCMMCGSPVSEKSSSNSSQDQAAINSPNNSDGFQNISLCYGCSRSING